MSPYGGFGFADELLLTGFFAELDEEFLGTEPGLDDEPEEPGGAAGLAEADDVLCG